MNSSLSLSESSNHLLESKNALIEVLGSESSKYFDLMRLWFKNMMSKEEFDSGARQLFSSSTVHVHNELLIAMLSHCHIRMSTPANNPYNHRKRKLPSQEHSERAQLQSSQPSTSTSADSVTPDQYSSYVDGAVPDLSMLLGRTQLAAWTYELEAVHSDAANLILHAMHDYMKRLLQRVIELRRSHLLLGASLPHTFGARKYVSKHTGQSGFITAPARTRISRFDLLQTLQLHPKMLCSARLKHLLLVALTDPE